MAILPQGLETFSGDNSLRGRGTVNTTNLVLFVIRESVTVRRVSPQASRPQGLLQANGGNTPRSQSENTVTAPRWSSAQCRYRSSVHAVDKCMY